MTKQNSITITDHLV